MGSTIYDLHLLKKRTVPLYCGACWKKHPKADRELLAMVTQRRTIHIIDENPLEMLAQFDEDERIRYDPLEEPTFPTPEYYAEHTTEAKETVARVFRVVKDPKPVSEDEVRADLSARRRDLTPEELEAEVNVVIGAVYSSRSAKNGRLGMVEVDNRDVDHQHCQVKCRSCGTQFVIDRTEAARIAAHVDRYKGVGYATTAGLVVSGGKKPYRSTSIQAG